METINMINTILAYIFFIVFGAYLWLVILINQRGVNIYETTRTDISKNKRL